jgi:hypothetical protein
MIATNTFPCFHLCDGQGRQSWWVACLLACVSEWNGQYPCTLWHGHYWVNDRAGRKEEYTSVHYVYGEPKISSVGGSTVQCSSFCFIQLWTNSRSANTSFCTFYAEMSAALGTGDAKQLFILVQSTIFYPCAFSYLLVALSGWKRTTVWKCCRPAGNPCPHMYFHLLKW